MMITRRKFMQGLLGTALTPLAAKADLIWVPEKKIVSLVPEVMDAPTRWVIMCESAAMSQDLIIGIRDQLNQQGIPITYRRTNFNMMRFDNVELYFFNALSGVVASLCGCEFTGAYFMGDISHEMYVQTLVRTRRWPHPSQLPEGFEWPRINEKIERLLEAT